jgi:hypothetical protein
MDRFSFFGKTWTNSRLAYNIHEIDLKRKEK